VTIETQEPAQPVKKKQPSSALAIVALVLASLFFVPLAPFVGLILGIIALVKARQGGTARTLAIIAVCIGPIFTFFNIGMCASIAIPAFTKYIRRSKTVEATMNVRRLADATFAYWQEHGQPPPASDFVPGGDSCGKYTPDPSLWKGRPWSDLHFSVDDPFYYQYRVTHLDDGSVSVEARGDLDCDQVFSSFQRIVTSDGVGTLSTHNEIE
jgi:hypothetical protein